MAGFFEENKGLEDMRTIIANLFASLSGKPTTTFATNAGAGRSIVRFANELDSKSYNVRASFTRKGVGRYQIVILLDTDCKEINNKVAFAMIESVSGSKGKGFNQALYKEMKERYVANEGWAISLNRDSLHDDLWNTSFIQENIEEKYFGPFEVMTLKV